jgi:hypothetical protein
VGAAAVALAVVAAVLVVIVGSGLGGGDDGLAAAPGIADEPATTVGTVPERTTATGAPSTTTAPTAAAIPGCPPRPGELACGDVRAEWSDGLAVVTVGGGPAVRYRLGRPGDQLLLADWDCDGDPDPVLYRPATGGLYRFHDWPTTATGAVSEPVVLLVPDRVALVADFDGDGCANIGVDPVAGG